MNDDAFAALAALERDPGLIRPELEIWFEAFLVIRWAFRAEGGVCLTAAGRQAYRDMVRERAGPLAEAPKRPAQVTA